MIRTRTIANCHADAAAFDWERWNREMDAALANWNAAEAALSQAHIDMARHVRAQLQAEWK